jgi:hypothetical protein
VRRLEEEKRKMEKDLNDASSNMSVRRINVSI